MIALLIAAGLVFLVASYGAKDAKEVEQNIVFLGFLALCITAPFAYAFFVS